MSFTSKTRELIDTWRFHCVLHASLKIREVTPINDERREVVRMLGKTEDGIEVYVDIELIGEPHELEKFRFEPGKYAGLVLRAID